MEQSSSKFQTKIMQEFDNFCKTVLKNAKKDHEKGIKVKRKYEVLFFGNDRGGAGGIAGDR